jgi:hypothetical protein
MQSRARIVIGRSKSLYGFRIKYGENGDWLDDDVLVRSLCGRNGLQHCGYIGADVRPDWSPHVNKRHV